MWKSPIDLADVMDEAKKYACWTLATKNKIRFGNKKKTSRTHKDDNC